MIQVAKAACRSALHSGLSVACVSPCSTFGTLPLSVLALSARRPFCSQ